MAAFTAVQGPEPTESVYAAYAVRDQRNYTAVQGPEFTSDPQTKTVGILFPPSTAKQGARASSETLGYSTDALTPGEAEVTTLWMKPAWALTSVETSSPARVRFYLSTSARDADLSRPIGITPEDDSGLVCEVVTTSQSLVWAISPAVFGASLGQVPVSIVNLSGTEQTIALTASYIATGA